MPQQPSAQDVHVDAILTQMSVAYIQDSKGFIASKVFPVVPVEKQTDLYYKYTKNDWFRDEARVRADATESAGSGYNLGTDSYRADVYAFHKDVGDQARKNADNPLSPDRDATAFVTSRMLLRQEIQWSTDYFTTGVWGTDITGVSGAPTTGQVRQWSDYVNSDPIEDIEAGKEVVLSTTGFMPQDLAVGYQVWRRLKNHPDLIDRVKYTTSANISQDIVARMFDIERLHVAWGVKATNLEGETDAYSFIHGKKALLSYVNPNPGLLAPSAGYIFRWNGISDGLGTEVGVTRFRMPELRADRIEAQMAWDNKIVAQDLGYFFNALVA